MLVLLSLLAADVPVQVTALDIATLKVVDQRVTIDQPPAPRRFPYRLDPNVTGPTDGKADALAITGSDCERIGTVYCTSTPRRIYAATY